MFGATPTLAGTPTSRAMRSRTCRANPSASVRCSAAPEARVASSTASHDVRSVTSRYASSMLTSRTVSAQSWRIAFTSLATDW